MCVNVGETNKETLQACLQTICFKITTKDFVNLQEVISVKLNL